MRLAISGVLVDQLSWRYLFVFGAVPMGIATLLVHRFVPESPIKTAGRLDVRGAAALGRAGLPAARADQGESWGWTSQPIVALLAAAAALFGFWALAEHQSRIRWWT